MLAVPCVKLVKFDSREKVWNGTIQAVRLLSYKENDIWDKLLSLCCGT